MREALFRKDDKAEKRLAVAQNQMGIANMIGIHQDRQRRLYLNNEEVSTDQAKSSLGSWVHRKRALATSKVSYKNGILLASPGYRCTSEFPPLSGDRMKYLSRANRANGLLLVCQSLSP